GGSLRRDCGGSPRVSTAGAALLRFASVRGGNGAGFRPAGGNGAGFRPAGGSARGSAGRGALGVAPGVARGGRTPTSGRSSGGSGRGSPGAIGRPPAR